MIRLRWVLLAIIVITIIYISLPSTTYDETGLPDYEKGIYPWHQPGYEHKTNCDREPIKNTYPWADPDAHGWVNMTDDLIEGRKLEWRRYVEDEAIPFEKVRHKFKGRGIVVVAGNDIMSVQRLRVEIRTLRQLGSKLPMEVHYFGNEMKKEWFDMLSFDPLVRFNNLSDPSNIIPAIRAGYQLKTLALINSKFQEMLMLDADMNPLFAPEALFDAPEYTSTGALFWPDMWRARNDNPIWRLVSEDCEYEEFEQESGQMVVDKRRHWMVLLLADFMNEQRFYNTILLGDKDMFRFSWKAMRADYYMMPRWLVSVGLDLNERYCGHTFLQSHPDGRYLFVHSGLLKYFKVNVMEAMVPNGQSLYQTYKRVPQGEDGKGNVIVDIDLYRTDKVLDLKDSEITCIDFRTSPNGPEVEYGQVTKIMPGFQQMFEKNGGYWQLGGKYEVN